MIKIKHNAGFFSCCSVRLNTIVDFINLNKKIPDSVDSSKQFKWYKNSINKDNDITFDYFENYDNIRDSNILYPIRFHNSYQYHNYSKLDYKHLTPLINKYFSLSNKIKEIIKNIERKYNINYENICVLFYRGNDKNRETKKCGYDEYLNYANQILKKNPNIVFLIQSDETEFINFMTNTYSNNSFYFKDEIRHMEKRDGTVDVDPSSPDPQFSKSDNLILNSQNYEFSQKYLAITNIMSKCKYIICGSGNCDMWIMFYRGNTENVIQNLNGSWYNSTV